MAVDSITIRQNEVESRGMVSSEQESVPPKQPNEIIVTNSDQGNTVAGRLIASLLTRIDTFDQHLISASQRLNKCETQLKSTRDDIAGLREDLAGLREELQATALTCSEIKGGLEERLQAIDYSLQERIKEFESSEKRLTNIETKLVNNIDELSEKLKTSQVEVNEKLSKLQNQLDQSVEEMKKEMADLSKLHPANNQSKPTFIESMDTLRSKLYNLVDGLIPKEAPERRRRSVTKRNISRPRSLLLQSDSLETMDPIDRQRSNSASSVASSGRGTLSHQQSKESLPVICEIDNPEQLLVIDERDNPDQQDVSLSLTNISSSDSPIGTNGSPQMSRTPAGLTSQQSNETSTENHRIIVEVVWAMEGLADQLKNLAGNFVQQTDSDTSNGIDNNDTLEIT